jgi:microcystin-dependent protein
MWGGTIASIPTGWLFCNGDNQLRANYPALFAAIGIIYGSMDASHFNIPDFRNQLLACADADVAGYPETTFDGASKKTGGTATTSVIGGTGTPSAAVSVSLGAGQSPATGTHTHQINISGVKISNPFYVSVFMIKT